MKNDKWDDFDELLTWATWQIIESLTKGGSIRSVMQNILSVAHQAKFKK